MYNTYEFDKEIKQARKYNTKVKLETVQAWRFNDSGSSSIAFCTMDRIMECYNEYKNYTDYEYGY